MIKGSGTKIQPSLSRGNEMSSISPKQLHCGSDHTIRYHLVREAFNKKKRWKLGFCPNLSDLPPSLAYLGILNCYFFIAYLGSIDHEMDFEINLFFPLTKVSWHLENFCILQYTFFINQIENWQIFLSIRPTHPKNAKMFFVFIICFRAF